MGKPLLQYKQVINNFFNLWQTLRIAGLHSEILIVFCDIILHKLVNVLGNLLIIIFLRRVFFIIGKATAQLLNKSI